MGCWTPVERFGFDPSLEWHAELLAADGSAFRVHHRGQALGDVQWSLLGRHNVLNGLAALAAAHAVGVAPADVIPALARFRSVKRRMEVIGSVDGITVYDDFAHHPTAIATTLEGLRAKVGDARIVVAMEPRSNSMRLGAHAQALAPSLALADEVVFLHRPELAWDAAAVIAAVRGQAHAVPDTDALLAQLQSHARSGDHVVFMPDERRRFAAAVPAAQHAGAGCSGGPARVRATLSGSGPRQRPQWRGLWRLPDSRRPGSGRTGDAGGVWRAGPHRRFRCRRRWRAAAAPAWHPPLPCRAPAGP
ncbi:hypothetical protein G6F57_015896 [Rhizopus arrhizus]|nr:hypothetical protein G6F57_015896 [Rhizopus arrhizus]